ncbi:MAG TPA: TlpA disulfide reductase family protein [Acidimicrobiales bacterium]
MMLVSIGAGTVVAIVLIAVVSYFTGGHVTTNANGPTSELVGKTVSGFTLPGLKGGTVNAPWKSGHDGVLIFFASWCGPCQKEMPEVAAYLRRHNEGSVHVIGVDAQDQRGAATSFVARSGVGFPVAFDPHSNVTAAIFKFLTLPETAFVNARGVVKQVYFGAIPKSELAKGIAALRSS